MSESPRVFHEDVLLLRSAPTVFVHPLPGQTPCVPLAGSSLR